MEARTIWSVGACYRFCGWYTSLKRSVGGRGCIRKSGGSPPHSKERGTQDPDTHSVPGAPGTILMLSRPLGTLSS